MTTGEHQAFNPAAAEIGAIRAELREVRDAGLVAHGLDGKNGLLSETRADLKAVSADLSKLRSTLWAGLVTIILSYGGVAIKACTDASNRAGITDERIEALMKARDDMEARFRAAHPSYSRHAE